MELTEKIARYVVELQYEQLPPEALAVAKTAFVDCIGVTLAGSREKSATICGQIARQEGAAAEASVYGQGFKSSALQAAFVNGTAAHALDFDHSLYLGQPTSGVIPATRSPARSMMGPAVALMGACSSAAITWARLVLPSPGGPKRST